MLGQRIVNNILGCDRPPEKPFRKRLMRRDRWSKNQEDEWLGDVPETDDFGYPITNSFIDGKTRMGPWATMSPESFRQNGVGLGLGKGQMYKKVGDKWVKQ